MATAGRVECKITEELYEWIAELETGGKEYYNKFLSRPTWPGAESGVTIGIGYDLGYNTRVQIRNDWDYFVSDEELNTLQAVAGIHGARAKSWATQISSRIKIPWDTALAVFNIRTIPRFWALTRKTFPGVENLEPEIQAALLSLVFNRGGSLEGARRLEMRQIQQLVANGKPKGIPDQLRYMKRLWAGTSVEHGLSNRREAEAKMVERGLSKSSNS